MMRASKMKQIFSLSTLALALVVPACGGETTADGTVPVATQKRALTTASTTDVVNSILSAATALQAATANLNDVLSGAYSVWPARADFQAAYTIRGYNNDLDALNAATFVAAAYAQGAYFNPSLNYVERQQLGAAYTTSVGSSGAYVIGGSFSGAYITPRGMIAGAYVAGPFSSSLAERVTRLNRE